MPKYVKLSSQAIISTSSSANLSIKKVVSQDILTFLKKVALSSTDKLLVNSINQFLCGITITDNGIALTDSSLDAILDLTNNSSAQKASFKNFFPKFKGFLTFLLPIVIPIMYEQYSRDIDAKLEQMLQMQNAKYQEEMLYIESQKREELKKHSIYFEQILAHLEEIQEDSSDFYNIADYLHSFLNMNFESLDNNLKSADVPFSHFSDEQSD